MRARNILFLSVVMAALAILLYAGTNKLWGVDPSTTALTGQVTSSEEGHMGGVVVSATKANSTITISVVSNDDGRFSFPRRKLDPGTYSLRIRAVGYDLNGPGQVQVTPQKAASVDLKLHKTDDLADQLTNAEWLASMPGTEEQKTFLLNCTICHSLQRIVKSHHTPDEWMAVYQRMSGYAPGTSPEHPQLRVQRLEGFGSQERLRKQAEWMATINLSKGDTWSYPLKTLPRPTGASRNVVVTEYALPRPETMPHDAIVDNKGMVWYTDFGLQYIGKLDPKTGKVTEYKVPLLKPNFPTGSLEIEQDKAGYIWISMMLQAGVGRFDPRTDKWTTWSLPKEVNTDIAQIAMVMPIHDDIDGKVWTNDAGTHMLHRLDISTGQFETFDPYKDIRTGPSSVQGHSIYGVVSDSHNNAYFMDFGKENIGRVDAETGRMQLFPTPTHDSRPRRGRMDADDRLFFSEYRVNNVAMFDTRTQQFQEWTAPTQWDAPYDVAPDKNGDVWAGGSTSDHVMRLDPKSGDWAEYLLPRWTVMRRVFVDNATTPVTFWAANNHGASLVKVEPLN